MKTCLIEVISGVEGPCLSVGTSSGGTRVAGPKPWGGGRVTNSFKVSIDTLIKELQQLKEAPECQE
jgi:hypothetical protein